MASLGEQLWAGLLNAFKSEDFEQLIKNVEKAYKNYSSEHSQNNKLKLKRLLIDSYAKLYGDDFMLIYKPRVESVSHKEYSEIASEIIDLITLQTKKSDRLEDYVKTYDPDKSDDHSFLLYFHSKYKTDFAHIIEKYDQTTKNNGMRGGKDAIRVGPEINDEGEMNDPLETIAADEKYIPGSEESEKDRRDNAITAIRQYSESLAAIKISDEKKRIFAIDATYNCLSELYKNDSSDIGKTSFLRSITNDYRKLKASFVQASDETFEIIVTIARSEKRFPTKGELAKHIGKDQGNMKRCYDAVREKIKEYEETNGLRN